MSSNTGSTKRTVSFVYCHDDRKSASLPNGVGRPRRTRTHQEAFSPMLSPCLSASDDQCVPASPTIAEGLNCDDSNGSAMVIGTPEVSKTHSVFSMSPHRLGADERETYGIFEADSSRGFQSFPARSSEENSQSRNSSPVKEKSFQPLLESSDDEVRLCADRFPKTPGSTSFSVRSDVPGLYNRPAKSGERALKVTQPELRQTDTPSEEMELKMNEGSVASAVTSACAEMSGHHSEKVEELYFSAQEVRDTLAETILFMISHVAVLEAKFEQSRKDFEAYSLRGLSMLHLRGELMLLKRRIDLRKETLSRLQEWRNEYVW